MFTVDVLQVQVHGGKVTDAITPDSTHLVRDARDLKTESVRPLELMQAVCSTLGGLQSLHLFKQSLLSGKLKLVSTRYSSCCRDGRVGVKYQLRSSYSKNKELC